MNREIAIGDIHGHFEFLEEIWRKIEFNPEEDVVIFLGDYIDRGPQSDKVVAFVDNLIDSYPESVIALKGNHEALACVALGNNIIEPGAWDSWMYNGGRETIKTFDDVNHCREVLKPFVGKLKLYHETDNAIYVHASIPFMPIPLEEVPEEYLLWSRDYDDLGDDHKPVIVGHTIVKECSREGSFILIDTSAFWNGKLSAFDILNDKVYKVEAGVNFYP